MTTEIITQNCSFSNPVYINEFMEFSSDFNKDDFDHKSMNWNFTEMNCISTSTAEVSSSTNPIFINSFTAGELINSTFIFFIFLAIAVIYFVFRYSGIKIKRQLW